MGLPVPSLKRKVISRSDSGFQIILLSRIQKLASKVAGALMALSKLLFVDDEAAIRVTLPAILKRKGFDVTVAATVPEALKYITQEQFDVLISDLNIGHPGDGFTVVSAMRRTQPDAVTLILTGYPDFETAVRALREQVDDYVMKPADVDQLIETIQNKLRSPKRKQPEQVKRVSTVLRENAERIIEDWFHAASRDVDLSSIPLPRAERVDHLPGILEELAASVDAGRFESSDAALGAARSHGRVRAEQGFLPRHIVIEAKLLHYVISSTLQENLLAINLSTLISDMIRIGASLHDQTEQSLIALEEQPSRELA
jgi:ActR/RegA family two-component response regulator